MIQKQILYLLKTLGIAAGETIADAIRIGHTAVGVWRLIMAARKKWSEMTPFEKIDWIRDQYGLENFIPTTIGQCRPCVCISNALVRDGDDVEDEYSIPDKKEKEEMNLDVSVYKTIESLCRDLVPFTSLDISNCVKKQEESVRHREIAHLVRQAFATGKMDKHGYLRTIIDVNLGNGSTTYAFLYHHATVDPSEYDDQKRSQMAAKPLKKSVKPPPAKSPVKTKLPVGSETLVRTQKGDGRLEIPGQWMERLDWEDGTVVSAKVGSGGGLVLTSNPDLTDIIIRTFTVDRWGRIRLTTGAMSKCGINFGPGGYHTMTLRSNGTIKVV